jgi:hypothetical protein
MSTSQNIRSGVPQAASLLTAVAAQIGGNARTCHYVVCLSGADYLESPPPAGKSDLPPNSEHWPYGEGSAGVARDKGNM